MNIQKYLTLPLADKRTILEHIIEKNPRFTIYGINCHLYLRDKETGIIFSYIPEGEYMRGLSIQEQYYAEKISDDVQVTYDEMRPTCKIHVFPFLISCYPITNDIISNIFINAQGDTNTPAYCTKEQVDTFCSELKMRLPTESEWEYVVRAGNNSLFPFGNELPNESTLEELMSLDFTNLHEKTANPLGLYGIFTGEWCSDRYSETYSSTQSETAYVVRGGAAQFWPWQDEEWVWCISAMRMPSSDLIDDLCAFRLVYDLK